MTSSSKSHVIEYNDYVYRVNTRGDVHQEMANDWVRVDSPSVGLVRAIVEKLGIYAFRSMTNRYGDVVWAMGEDSVLPVGTFVDHNRLFRVVPDATNHRKLGSVQRLDSWGWNDNVVIPAVGPLRGRVDAAWLSLRAQLVQEEIPTRGTSDESVTITREPHPEPDPDAEHVCICIATVIVRQKNSGVDITQALNDVRDYHDVQSFIVARYRRQIEEYRKLHPEWTDRDRSNAMIRALHDSYTVSRKIEERVRHLVNTAVITVAWNARDRDNTIALTAVGEEIED